MFLDHKKQLLKLQETIKKNQDTISKNQVNLKPESEDPLNVEDLKKSGPAAEFV